MTHHNRHNRQKCFGDHHTPAATTFRGGGGGGAATARQNAAETAPRRRRARREPRQVEVPGLAPFYRWEGKYAMVDASIADIVATLNRRGSPTWVSCSGLRADHSEDRWRSAYIGFRHISLPVVVAFIKAGFTFDDGNSVCARAFEDDGRDPATGAMGSDAMLAQKWETLRRLLS